MLTVWEIIGGKDELSSTSMAQLLRRHREIFSVTCLRFASELPHLTGGFFSQTGPRLNFLVQYILYTLHRLTLVVAIRQIWGQVRERMVDVFTSTLVKNNITFSFSSHIRKFRRDRLQSHIWLTSSSYMVKYLRNSSYMTLQPIPSEFPYIWGKFLFLFY